LIENLKGLTKMSRNSGEKGRANIHKKRRTAMRVKTRAARAEAAPAKEAPASKTPKTKK
jgi:hypothetical protein